MSFSHYHFFMIIDQFVIATKFPWHAHLMMMDVHVSLNIFLYSMVHKLVIFK